MYKRRHCEERFVRRSNPVFKHTGLLRLQKAQARNDGTHLRNKPASIPVIIFHPPAYKLFSS